MIYDIELSSTIDQFLISYSSRAGISKERSIERALALLAVADEAIGKGNAIGILRGRQGSLEPVGIVTNIFPAPA